MFKKVYAVEFNEYSDCLRDTVCDDGDVGSTTYIHLPKYGSFLIFEDQIDYYKQFGKGYKSLMYIGEIEVAK